LNYYDFLRVFVLAYLTALVLVLLWITIKAIGSELRLERIQKRGADARFKTELNPRVVIILVHGTWALGSEWHRPNSDFVTSLMSALPIGKGPYQLDRFLWAGGTSLIDRKRAITGLTNHLFRSTTKHAGVPHFLIAHSHGGNVALKTLLNETDLSKRVLGLCCVATPFILNDSNVAEASTPWSKWASKASRLVAISAPAMISTALAPQLMGAAAFSWYVAVFSAILALGAVFMLGRYFASITERTTIPADGVDAELFEKLLFVRAAGDEASAALGAAYVIRSGLLAAWGATLRKASRLMNPFEWQPAEGMNGWQIMAFAILLVLIAVRSFDPTFYERNGLPYIPDNGNWGIFLMSCLTLPFFINLLDRAVSFSLLLWRGVVECITWLLYVPADFMSGFLLMPFAPELMFTLAVSGLSAETTVPQKNCPARSNLYQLPFMGRRVLNHTAYDHPETPAVITTWLTQKLP
jgi:hypothetical protein